MKTCLVIPCHNEEQRILLPEYAAFYKARPEVSFVFVDDGSTDQTLHLLEQFARGKEDRVFVVSLLRNAGKAEAVRSGVLQALKAPDFECIGFMDADLAVPLDEMDRLLTTCESLSTSSIVFASRINRPDALIRRSVLRRLCAWGFAVAARFFLGFPTCDTQCGAKLIRAGVAAEIFRRPFISRWIFDVELFLRTAALADTAPGTFVEVPLAQWIEKGNSRVGVPDVAGIVREFFTIWRRHGRVRHLNRNMFVTLKSFERSAFDISEPRAVE